MLPLKKFEKPEILKILNAEIFRIEYKKSEGKGNSGWIL